MYGPFEFATEVPQLGIPPIAIVYVDGISGLMLTLVALIGSVVSIFSKRYLDSDVRQDSFYSWLALAVTGTSAFVISGNIALSIGCLWMAGYAVSRLLRHNPEQFHSRRSSWLKFVFDRLSDFALISACFVVIKLTGTLNISELYSLAENGQQADEWAVVGALFAIAAVIRSVQVPFHSWLPETLGAPTPVSALIHAGVVNAGGYLMVRFAPIIVFSPSAMTATAFIGLLTVVAGVLVMQTQSSVKGTLVWSTIAQMGFMMLQCGVGAFSAAMLHIVVHSIYKSYCFLANGTTELRPQVNPHYSRISELSVRALKYAVSLMIATGIFLSVSYAMAMNILEKPGGILLGAVLTAGVAFWITQFAESGLKQRAKCLVISTLLFVTYSVSFTVADTFVHASLPSMQLPDSTAVLVAGLTTFVVLAGMEFGKSELAHRSAYRSLYVFALNGFYLDRFWNRLYQQFRPSTS